MSIILTLQDMLHTVVDFALFHNHPHVQCRLLRKQKIIVTEMHEGSRVLSRVLSGLHEVLRIYPTVG